MSFYKNNKLWDHFVIRNFIWTKHKNWGIVFPILYFILQNTYKLKFYKFLKDLINYDVLFLIQLINFVKNNIKMFLISYIKLKGSISKKY